MKRFIIAILIVTIAVCCLSFSYAIDYSYEQVIGIIDAITIDGVKLFGDGQDASVRKDREDFFTLRGSFLLWMEDIQEGQLVLVDNDSRKDRIWSIKDIENRQEIFDIIGTILDDYIDYDKGGKITFIVTSDVDFTHPFLKMEYSPVIDSLYKTDSAEYNFYYSDLDTFCKEAKEWFMLFKTGKAASYDQENGQGSNPTVLQKGSKGEEVKKLQERLNELGYSVGKADGDFGNKTKAAIEQFQKENGLEVTGIADAKTQELLYSDNAKAHSAETNSEAGTDSKGNSELLAAGAKYISDYAMEIAPTVLGVTKDECRITEIYCLDKGNGTYQFTVRVSRGGPGGFGFGKNLTIKSKASGGYDISTDNNLIMYGGSDTIPGDLIFGSAGEASAARGSAILAEYMKEIDANGDGELSMDEIFKMN